MRENGQHATINSAKHMKKHGLLVVCFVLILGSASAQKIKRFTADPTVYPTELAAFLKQSKVDKIALDSLMLDFNGVWNNGTIDDSEAEALYKISNNLLKKRVIDFESWNYLIKIMVHIEYNELPELHLPWLEGFEKFSSKQKARASRDYLRTTYLSFYENTFFDNGRSSWKALNGEYEFKYEGEPMFVYEAMDLWGYYKNDSTQVEGTGGVFYPLRYEFVGNGGYAYFVRAGLSQDTASVELSTFKVNVTKTNFEADSVVLSTLIYLKDPTLGRFEEKLTSQSGRGGTFPRFTSYAKDIVIKDIVPGADFEGGFSMVGSKFYGSGTPDNQARFRFSYEGKPIISAQSERFLLRLDKIYSEKVAATIYLEEDSIHHPKVTLRYLPEGKQLTIIRKPEGLGRSPFSNTYHDIDMVFEILNWKVDEPQMKLGNLNLGSESPVLFESKNYYRGSRFSAIQGLDNQNPLYRLKSMTDYYQKRDFSDKEVAQFLRMDLRAARSFMMQMSIMGFVNYNLNDHTMVLQDKIFDYINNFEDVRDYDVIRFVSNIPQGDNAKLSLLDYSMEIEGVQAIALSDSQKVGLFPAQQKITLYKDLNFDFDGRITAGRFSYWGESFKFNYEQFRIGMENIDSMRFKVESFDQNALGQRRLVDVKTVLQGLTGEILIDESNNKSGRKVYTEYPIFRSAKDSYIYYDKPTIFSGVYNRDEFYVTLEPFEIDSLDNITTEGLKFDGTFTSAGIFPDLTEEIKVQPDYSLGFVDETPPDGLSAYGKGTFTNTLSLSNKGLKGDGAIDYLNSQALSQEFFFFPDSTNGVANSYEITAQMTGPETPHVLGDSVFLHWEPKNDVLFTTTLDAPFDMYDEVGMRATGTLEHTPSQLFGKGLLEFYDAETRSQDYTFNNRSFTSDEMAFRVRANSTADWGFSMDDANGVVDFDTQKGDFYLNDPADYFKFPANQYICFMDYAQWQIPEKAIDVEKTGSLASSKMVSTHPRQDSLQFQAGFTKFYLENSLLESFKVPNIDVADASIFPDTGYVAIDKGAKMRTLSNAKITANRASRYHDFYGGIIDITSRYRYTGMADYEYLDEDGTPWPVRFHSIKVDTSLTTVGKADVTEEEGFFMSPYFAYYGKIELRANRKTLNFNGYTHIDTDCKGVNTNWFKFQSIIDPANIIIDLPEIDPNDRTKSLANGIFLDADTIGGYAAFLAKNVSPNDKQMFFANGKLLYDKELGEYVITSGEKLKDPSVKGNHLSFSSINCTMLGKGEMSLGDNRSQMDINSWGVIEYDLSSDIMVMDMVMALDFFFSDDVQKEMAAVINGNSELEGSDLSREAFEVTLNEVLDPKDAKEFKQDVADYGAPEKLPKEFVHTILFSDLVMNWTPDAVSFLSEGKIGLASLGKYQVNKKLKGKMEIQRKRRGDEIYLYLEASNRDYFYIEYKRNRLTFYSSNDALMDIIKNLEIKDRRSEVKGKPVFTYLIGTKGKMNRFLTRFEEFD